MRRNINILRLIGKEHLDILVYNFYDGKTIEKLNKLNNIKIIYYDHASIAHWIYEGKDIYNTIYQSYKKCKYVISFSTFGK